MLTLLVLLELLPLLALLVIPVIIKFAENLTHLLNDNLKSRDASAFEKYDELSLFLI